MATAMNATVEEGVLQEAIHFALAKTNNTHIKLKEEQREAVSQVVNGRDVIAVLPTGFGKSLIYHLLPYVFDYINSKRRNISAVWPESVVIVISPLNALMDDQIGKLKIDMGVEAVVLRHDDQEMKDIKGRQKLVENRLIFCHPEVVVNNRAIQKEFQSKEFQKRVKCIVIDEAHLVSEWSSLSTSCRDIRVFVFGTFFLLIIYRHFRMSVR